MVRTVPPVCAPVTALLICCLAGPAHAQDIGATPDLGEAYWIWSSEAQNGVVGLECFLRRRFTLEAPPVEATILITADNGWALHVNNRLVAEEVSFGGTWGMIRRFRVEHLMTRGANVIAVRGENLGGAGGVLIGVLIRTEDGAELQMPSNAQWLAHSEPSGNWAEPDHDDSLWWPASLIARFGGPPWGGLETPQRLTDVAELVVDRSVPGGAAPLQADSFTEPEPGFAWPDAVVFVEGRAPHHTTQAQDVIWSIRGSRAFFEYDSPAPAAMGHALQVLSPAQPGSEPRTILDAGAGLVAGPAVSFSGEEILFAMAPEGGKFFHVYSIRPDGNDLTRLTDGPWQDYDPAELPDGRVVFSSTRIGCREEYHANPARSLFTLDRGTGLIEPLTFHIVADSEPRVTADGRVAFIRQDNFMERAKVETHIHCVRPDGTRGETLLGPSRQAIQYGREYGAEEPHQWLRELGFGSPSPLPHGPVAAISHLGVTVSGPADGHEEYHVVDCQISPYDLAPLPDGRLLASTLKGGLAIVEPNTGVAYELLPAEGRMAHSPAYLGPRPRPPVLSAMSASPTGDEAPFGYLLCQSIYETRQVEGDWQRVTGVRVVMGEPSVLRSARHQYGHVGTTGVELGTVPLAPDGSFYARVPADRPLFMQAVDGEGRAVVNEMSWVYVRPGETRSCVGCHTPRQEAPPGLLPLAMTAPPADLTRLEGAHRYRANNAANGGVLNLQFDRFREVAAITPLPTAPDLGELVAALHDPDPSTRMRAATLLSRYGTRSELQPLANSVADPSPLVALAAHHALAHLTGRAASATLFGAQSERAAAAEAWRDWLARVDWAAHQADLARTMLVGDPATSHEAIEALGHIGDEVAATALRECLQADPSLGLPAYLSAVRALGRLQNEQSVPVLRSILEASVGDTVGPAAKSHEFGWYARPDHAAAAAAESLGAIGTPEAEQALLDALDAMREFWFYTFRTADHEWLMGCHASMTHYRIIEALNRVGSTRAGPLVEAVLRSVPMDSDRGILLENDAYEQAVAELIDRSGRTQEVISACLAVLGGPNAQVTDELLAAVQASPPAVSVGPLTPAGRAAQLLSVVTLAPADEPAVRAALARYRAADPSAEQAFVSFYLARALGKLGESASLDLLADIVRNDPPELSVGIPDPPNVFVHEAWTPCYRAAAADALGRIGDASAFDLLVECVGNMDNAMDTRYAAAGALRMLARPEHVARLGALVAGYPEVVTGRVLREALATARGG